MSATNKLYIRPDWREDNHNGEPLEAGEPVDVYHGDDIQTVVYELIDRGGGYMFDDSGNPCRFVAPEPNVRVFWSLERRPFVTERPS